ncbi:MAG: 16S rRNA (adenine(1518)-N(6)/adenine(1519)-N(6))-dimethyltransferase RsmA [Bacteroidales bacterium]|nr:16S rRNA (adenine(1518)-N(6)/adenine(1519)-N(6))-dimethyltransferase RsmA [Bacteroidales bacterium]
MDNVRAKKNLGQHFLVDTSIAHNIVNSLSGDYLDVLEVGPGMGALTSILLENDVYRLHVVEIDQESVAYLEQHLPQLRGRIWQENFLKMDFDKIFSQPFAIIGNFPYNISSQILFKILDEKDKVPEVVGMFQKEVAERIASAAGNKSYGILSVLLQAFYDIEYLFTVNENAFNPPPKVKSAVIRLKRNQVQHLDCDEKIFKQIVKTAFNQRRKMLRNSLKNICFEEDFTKKRIFDQRPETLSVADFIYITQHVTDPSL